MVYMNEKSKPLITRFTELVLTELVIKLSEVHNSRTDILAPKHWPADWTPNRRNNARPIHLLGIYWIKPTDHKSAIYTKYPLVDLLNCQSVPPWLSRTRPETCYMSTWVWSSL